MDAANVLIKKGKVNPNVRWLVDRYLGMYWGFIPCSDRLRCKINNLRGE